MTEDYAMANKITLGRLGSIIITHHDFVVLGDGIQYSKDDHIRQIIEWDTEPDPTVIVSINWYNITKDSSMIPPLPHHLFE